MGVTAASGTGARTGTVAGGVSAIAPTPAQSAPTLPPDRYTSSGSGAGPGPGAPGPSTPGNQPDSPLFAPLLPLDPTIRTEMDRGYLPADFGNPFAYGANQRSDMMRGAERIARHPHLQALMSQLRPGDVVAVKCPDPFITGFTGTDWTHCALCISADPPTFIEAIGMTGDHASQVRVAPYSQIIGDNREDATFELVRPCPDPTDPKQAQAIQRAISFAKAQVGKPYDYAFAGNSPKNDAWYCSDLVWAAYDRSPAQPKAYLALDEAGRARRDGKAAAALKVAGALGVSDDLTPEVSQLIQMIARNRPVSERVDYLMTAIVPKLPSSSPLYDLYRAPGGPAALRRLFTDTLNGDLHLPDVGAGQTEAQGDLGAAGGEIGSAKNALGGFFHDPLGSLNHATDHLGGAMHDALSAAGVVKGDAGQGLGAIGHELQPLGWQGLLLLRDAPQWLNLAQVVQAALGDMQHGAVDPNLVTPADVALGANQQVTFSPSQDAAANAVPAKAS